MNITPTRTDEVIHTRCPECGKERRVPAWRAGGTLRCSECTHTFQVPPIVPVVAAAPSHEAAPRIIPPPPSIDTIVRLREKLPPPPRPPRPGTGPHFPAASASPARAIENASAYGTALAPAREPFAPAAGTLVDPASESATPAVALPADQVGPLGVAEGERLSPSGLSLDGSDASLWRLRWLFPLMLVPLALYLAFAPESPYEQARKRLAELKPLCTPSATRSPKDIRPEDIAAMKEVEQRLERREFPGALFARDSWGHWFFALLATLVFSLYVVVAFPAGRTRMGNILLVGFLVATVGVLALLLFQIAAQMSYRWVPRGGGLGIILFLVIKFIGFSYQASFDPANGFLPSFLGFIFGVGLCEELVKAFPLLWHQRRSAYLDWRGMVTWGLAGGVGFGITEGIFYSGGFYNGIESGWVYAVRFLSCVSLHAAWSGTAAIFLARRADLVEGVEEWYEWIRPLAVTLGPSILLHALFDTLLKQHHELLALAVAGGSFALFLVLYEGARRGARTWVPARA